MAHFILKIACKDEKGLIYHISQLIFKHGLNIVKNNEFVGENEFFFRAELEGGCDEKGFLAALEEALPKPSTLTLLPRHKQDIIILATKEAHCLGDLLIRHYSGTLNATIKAVISNHNDLKDLVEKFNIPYHFISSENLSREVHEALLLEALQAYKFDYLVLAKYMRVLSPDFIAPFAGKIINIHHSFLPAFIGANPYKQAYERGVKIIGATAHFVSDELDAGPIITQEIIPISHEFSASKMKKAGQDVEKIALAKALELVFDERVFIFKNKTIVF